MSDKQRRYLISKNLVPPVPRDEDVKIIALRRIAKLVKQRGGLVSRGLDMEPFEILRDLLREKVSPHIGGAPQLVKIYPSCNSTHFGVLWPNKESNSVLFQVVCYYNMKD